LHHKTKAGIKCGETWDTTLSAPDEIEGERVENRGARRRMDWRLDH